MEQKVRKRIPARNSPLNSSDDKMTSQKKSKSNKNMSSFMNLKIILLLFVLMMVIFFVVIPFAFANFPAIQRMALFMNTASLHYFYNLSDPSQFGLKCTEAFRIDSDDGISLGTWHVFPKEDCSKKLPPGDFTDGKLIILYSHGNTGSRMSSHRVSLYKKLSIELGAHVIAYDYRGYADSTSVSPTARGIVNDLKNVHKWILNQNVSPKRIIVWGHSLGTAVTSQFLGECPTESYPLGGVLEGSFTSVYEASESYPLSRVFSFLPYFEKCFLEPMIKNKDTNFNTTAQFPSIRCPLLILHAEDDAILHFSIGQKVYQQAKELQPKEVIRARFVSFPAEKGYGHKQIVLDPDLTNIVKEFIQSIPKKN